MTPYSVTILTNSVRIGVSPKPRKITLKSKNGTNPLIFPSSRLYSLNGFGFRGDSGCALNIGHEIKACDFFRDKVSSKKISYIIYGRTRKESRHIHTRIRQKPNYQE